MKKLLLTLMVSMGFLLTAVAQKTVTGKVTDANGTPLSNVSVIVQGTKVGTTTDNNGNYTITVPANGKVLLFSSLGFVGESETVGNRSVISPKLSVSGSQELEGVVVTGISRIKKSQYTGATTKLVAKEIEEKPMGSLDQIFQGRVPGLMSMTSSGQPGTSAFVNIRGLNSVSGGVEPLYILDGIPIEAGVFQSLNPNDIASVDILRDAATQSLYGSRGSGGIISITSKRGQAGKIKVRYSGQLGVKSRPDFAYRPMNTSELLKAQHDYGKVLIDDNSTNTNRAMPGWYYSPDNPRYQALSPADQLLADAMLDSISAINTNWYDEFFRQGTFSNHEISVSGGTGKTRFFSSVGLYNEEGIINPSGMKRATMRNNIDFADDKFTFQFSSNIGYVKRESDPGGGTSNSIRNSFFAAALASPYSLARDAAGNVKTGGNAGDLGYLGPNLLDMKKFDRVTNNQIKVTAGITMGYKITDNLTANITTGIDFRETQSTTYRSRLAYIRQPGITTSQTELLGSQSEGLTRFFNAVVRPSLTYKRTIKERHDFDVTLLGEYVQENNKAISFTGYNIDPRTPNNPGTVGIGNGVLATQAAVGGGLSQAAIVSGLAMGRYTYDDKYTISASYRRDGSSKLPPNTRWQNFYSVGAVWDMTKENFIKDINAINTLRLKLSYGGVGNHDNFPAYYMWQATYGTGGYAGLTTQVPTYPGNLSAKWERTNTLNVGLDFELLKRRIYGDLSWYDRRTKDVFIDKPLPAEGGGLTVPMNAGELQNTGVEWNLNFDVVKKKDLVVTLYTTGAYNKNELISLGGLQPYEEGTSFLVEGMPLGTHYEVTWAGVDASTGQPLYYDLNGNLTNVYTASNANTNHGTWLSPWTGGFGTAITYKDFDMSVLFSFQQGATKVDNLEYFMENPSAFMTQGINQSASLNFWTQPGDVTTTPSPKYPLNFSSKIIHDASFLRLRDVVVGYTLPKNVLADSKYISALRVYVQASNLFMWTKWRGLDPEAGAVNLNLSEFPNPRAFTFGVNVTF